MEGPLKRRRVQRSPSPAYDFDQQDDDYELYVPLAQRREQKLAKLVARGTNVNRVKSRKQPKDEVEHEDAESEEERRKEKARRERTLLMEAQEVHMMKAAEDAQKTAVEKAEEADAEILAAIASRRKLASDLELAKGIEYTEPLKTSWQPPRYIRDKTEADHRRLREKYHILVDGDNVPPPIEHFSVRRPPSRVCGHLRHCFRI
jgi:ATP-dependent RNA helicase DDX41